MIERMKADIKELFAVMIPCKNVILRDQAEEDIADEIRWMTEETGWIKADTPWEPVAQIDPDELKDRMMMNIAGTNEKTVRNRMEIVAEGVHIGFVCAYPFTAASQQDSENNRAEQKAVGIEICEPAFRNRGYGTGALQAWSCYQR